MNHSSVVEVKHEKSYQMNSKFKNKNKNRNKKTKTKTKHDFYQKWKNLPPFFNQNVKNKQTNKHTTGRTSNKNHRVVPKLDFETLSAFNQKFQRFLKRKKKLTFSQTISTIDQIKRAPKIILDEKLTFLFLLKTQNKTKKSP